MLSNIFFLNLDLIQIYNSALMDPDKGPVELQRKVMFDVRFFMCRRGGENIVDMTKSTFNLMYDKELNMAYVKKVEDEMTKNRRENDNELITGFMPQILNADGSPSRLCPVRSFENYISRFQWKQQVPLAKD